MKRFFIIILAIACIAACCCPALAAVECRVPKELSGGGDLPEVPLQLTAPAERMPGGGPWLALLAGCGLMLLLGLMPFRKRF